MNKQLFWNYLDNGKVELAKTLLDNFVQYNYDEEFYIKICDFFQESKDLKELEIFCLSYMQLTNKRKREIEPYSLTWAYYMHQLNSLDVWNQEK
ncbi:TPA: hypothetical protein R1740_001604, partial [Campylobacter lari]|nr:hypothetical protein [Campylobacter lari]